MNVILTCRKHRLLIAMNMRKMKKHICANNSNFAQNLPHETMLVFFGDVMLLGTMSQCNSSSRMH